MTGDTAERSSTRPWWYIVRLIRFRPWLYLALAVLETLMFGAFPQIVGWITYAFFDALAGKAPAGLGVWSLIALLLGTAVARIAAIFTDVYVYFQFQYSVAALLRRNLFEHILRRPGARAVPGSPGEAISRFREDVEEIAGFMSESLILLGFGFFALVSVVVMLRINARIALVVLLPLTLVAVAVNLAAKHIERYREVFRKATGAVTGFLGEMVGAVQAVQVATAEERLVGHFRSLNDARKVAGVRDRLLTDLLESVFHNAAVLSTGLILLLAAGDMRTGGFTVAEFALFVYYLGWVTDFAGLLGERWAWYKRVGVSVQRLLTLLQDAAPGRLVEPHRIYLHGELPSVPLPARSGGDRLETLAVTGLTYRYPDTGQGIEGIDLRLDRGTITVVTGRVGSGKTTFLRALLGLLPRDAGEIRWNGQLVEDPAAFLVPPRSAYTAQIPLLFSESLHDNILMGLPDEQVDLVGALYRAVLEKDLSEWEKGIETPLGAKGVKVSGGQKQRTAAARMFVREPELLVLDDLSSALDVETEQLLWQRAFEANAERQQTYLVVSHRQTVLRRADQIVVLKGGRVEAVGQFANLLSTCEEMRRLVSGDIGGQEWQESWDLQFPKNLGGPVSPA